MRSVLCGSVVLAMCCGLSVAAHGAEASPEAVAGEGRPPEAADESAILDLDIDQLGKVDVVAPSFEVEVTSVERRQSTVGKSPAAIFVITREMIRRSGATSIPEVLRMAPGLDVARIDANKWAISVRGFSSRFSNKLLVLIDGRSVYSPLFSGVYWDVQDTLLEDIERIEVIRGPGATVWGANAVNGVINIITQQARDTQGLLFTGTGGSEDQIITGLRYGASMGDDFHYRVYAKHFERDAGFCPVPEHGDVRHDDWRQKRFGFRSEWRPGGSDSGTLTFQGDYYDGASGSLAVVPPVTPPFQGHVETDADVWGGNLLARWTRPRGDGSDASLQFYYDRAARREFNLGQTIDTLDVDFTCHFPLFERHEVTWGLGYRYVRDHLTFPLGPLFSFDPPSRAFDRVDGFVQDTIRVIPEKLEVTLGTKLEHNDFTQFEVQPSARVLWTLNERRVAWAAVSRAVRTPSRLDDDAFLSFAALSPAPPTTLALVGNRDFESEDLLEWEAGFRAQPSDRLAWDVAAFFGDYSDLEFDEPRAPIFRPPVLVFPLSPTNRMSGETYGVEVHADYQVAPRWRIDGSYSFLRLQLHGPGSALGTSEIEEGASPRNEVWLQSSWDSPSGLELDVIGRYVDSLPTLDVDSYLSLDLRLGWRPNDRWEWSVVGRNLLDGHRREFTDFTHTAHETEVQRGVYGQVIWRR